MTPPDDAATDGGADSLIAARVCWRVCWRVAAARSLSFGACAVCV